MTTKQKAIEQSEEKEICDDCMGAGNKYRCAEDGEGYRCPRCGGSGWAKINKKSKQAPTQPDLISREKVIKAIKKAISEHVCDSWVESTKRGYEKSIEIINQIQSEGNNE
jgi:hypothetical protein